MSEADRPPLIFVKSFGALRAGNKAAEDALKAIPDGKRVRVRITGLTANQRRRGFYWSMLEVAASALADRTGDPWDSELLHRELKVVLKLGDEFTTPSGRVVFKPRSTSNKAMPELERARWTDRCGPVLSRWLEVPVTDLMDAVRAADGE